MTCEYAECTPAWSGKVMNDAKWKKGWQTVNTSFCVYLVATTSVFTTEGGQVQAGNCYCICIFSLLPCTAFLSPGSSADITYLSTKRGQAEISHPCMLTKMFGLPPACSAYSLTPPCSPLSTACLHKLNPWSAKWTFPVHMCVCVCLCV